MAYGVEHNEQYLLEIVQNGSRTGKYLGARIDESGSVKYYGFLSRKQEWYIMSIDASGTNKILYFNDLSKNNYAGFLAAWTNRGTLAYDDYCNIQLT